MQSIKIITNECKFKFRVSGLLIHDNKILTTDMDNSGFFCLPGGYVGLGEDTEKAIIREMNEEVKYKVKIDKCIAIIENFFVNKNNITMHEIAFYYLLKLKNNKETIENYKITENDNGRKIEHDFKWINLNNIKAVDFRPAILKNKLSNLDFNFEHLIYREQ